jgi:hypothetical protein
MTAATLFDRDETTSPEVIAGTSLPTGGTTDQVLAKVDGTDFNVYWKNDATGGGGGSYWDFENTVQTGDFTAVAGKYYFLDTAKFFGSQDIYTITLPASPSVGDRVGFACNLDPGTEYPSVEGSSVFWAHNRWDVEWDSGGGVTTQISLGYTGGSSGPGIYVMSAELYYISSNRWVLINTERAEIAAA